MRHWLKGHRLAVFVGVLVALLPTVVMATLDSDLNSNLWCSTSELTCSASATAEANAITSYAAGAFGPINADYVTASSNATLTAERVATTTASVSINTGTAGQMKWDVLPAGVDHGGLGGLSDDDHAQYMNINGRSGGQTITCGTGSGDDCTFDSTSNGTNGDYIFGSTNTDAVQRMGIGTSSPTERLTVETAIASRFAAGFYNLGNNANRLGIFIQAGENTPTSSTSGEFIRFFDGDGTLTGACTANGSGTFSCADVSDERRKANIAPTKIDGSTALRQLQIVEFQRKDVDSEGKEHLARKVDAGFLAQQVDAVWPEAVVHLGTGELLMNDGALVPVLVRGFQEQAERADDLETYVILLEQRLETMETRLSALEAAARPAVVPVRGRP